MAAACEMLQENEIELSLGLSLGGCFSKSEKLRQKSGEVEAVRSGGSPISGEVSEENKGVQVEGEVLDPQMKRKIQALRRQEAKKKREEKHQKKGSTARGGGELETQDYPSRVRDRDSFENESGSEQIYKKAKASDEEDQPDVNLGWKQSHSSNPSSAFVPVVATPYNFPHLQYIPFANSVPVPYPVPYWAAPPPPPPPASNAGGEEKSVFQLVACRAFQPFQAQKSNASQLVSGSSDSGSKQLYSSGGSLGSGSSGVSDYQSTSHQGCCSSETRSQSTHSGSEQPELHTMLMTDAQGQTEQTVSSHPTEPNQVTEEPEQKAQKMVSSSPFQTNSEKTERKPTDNAPSNSPTPAPRPPKEGKGEANKPPKPPQHQAQKTQALPHMPCVSTTGNGPNGKTITGFLYKYNKTEVSIMCICHGSSFTPAEFLKHAGCTDVSNPLKHIVVVRSPF